MTLTDFLLARIAEDEAQAKMVSPDANWTLLANSVAGQDYGAGWHMFRHNPARVLAECKAKRQMVENVDYADSPDIHVDAWVFAKTTLRDLAAVYSSHPDYRADWRP